MIQAFWRLGPRSQQAIYQSAPPTFEATAGVITQPHGTTDYRHQRRYRRKTFADGGSQDYSLGD
jgi:hypothetical protein